MSEEEEEEGLLLSVCCRNLLQMDVLSDLAPVVALFARDENASSSANVSSRPSLYRLIAQTEVARNTLDPSFARKFPLPSPPKPSGGGGDGSRSTTASSRKKLLLRVYSASSGGQLGQEALLGQCYLSVSVLLAEAMPGQAVAMQLQHPYEPHWDVQLAAAQSVLEVSYARPGKSGGGRGEWRGQVLVKCRNLPGKWWGDEMSSSGLALSPVAAAYVRQAGQDEYRLAGQTETSNDGKQPSFSRHLTLCLGGAASKGGEKGEEDRASKRCDVEEENSDGNDDDKEEKEEERKAGNVGVVEETVKFSVYDSNSICVGRDDCVGSTVVSAARLTQASVGSTIWNKLENASLPFSVCGQAEIGITLARAFSNDAPTGAEAGGEGRAGEQVRIEKHFWCREGPVNTATTQVLSQLRETLAFGSPFVRHYAVDSRPAKGHSQADPLGKEGEGQARGAGVAFGQAGVTLSYKAESQAAIGGGYHVLRWEVEAGEEGAGGGGEGGGGGEFQLSGLVRILRYSGPLSSRCLSLEARQRKDSGSGSHNSFACIHLSAACQEQVHVWAQGLALLHKELGPAGDSGGGGGGQQQGQQQGQLQGQGRGVASIALVEVEWVEGEAPWVTCSSSGGAALEQEGERNQNH